MSELASVLQLVSEQELLDFVTAQRWFGARAGDIVGLRLLDQALLRTESPLLVDALAEVRYGGGTHDVYQLVIGIREDGEPSAVTISAAGERTTFEAIADPDFARELIRLVKSGSTVPAGEGSVEFGTLGAIDQNGNTPRDVRPLGVEQTNSSVVLDEKLLVKAYRRLEAGMNPELEMLRFLVTHDFANVPELSGWWSYSGTLMSATLGIVQRFVPNSVDGWSLALEELPAERERFLGRIWRLGEVVGTMHAVLASDNTDPAFCPEEARPEMVALLAATVDDEIEQAFLHLPDDESVAAIAGRGDAVRDLLRGLTAVGDVGRLIRSHGDLHLGQALWAEEDWSLVDFEGEPDRALPERRRKRSPLRDVAGMLRSFAYAAAVGKANDDFEERARTDFLAAYMGAVQSAGILPSPDATMRLIGIFELEKAVYELRYEIGHRPDWVPIPVAGIVRLLEGGSRVTDGGSRP